MSKKKSIVDIQLQIEGVLKELRASDPKTRDIALAVTDLENAQLRLLKEAVETNRTSKAKKPRKGKKGIVISDPCSVEPLASAPWYIRFAFGCFGS